MRSPRSLWLVAADAALLCACCVAAIYIRFGGQGREVMLQRLGWLKVLLVTLVVQTAFYLVDLYDADRTRRRAVLVLGILQGTGIASMGLAVIFYSAPGMMLGRGALLLSVLLILVVMVHWRLMLLWLSQNPRFAEKVLILGTGENAVRLAREVLSRRNCGYEVVGFLGDEPSLVGKSLINPRVIGLYDQLDDVVDRYKASRVVVATADRRKRLPLGPLMALKLCGKIAVEESASFYERLTGKISTEMLRPSWLIFSNEADLRRLYRRMTKVVDIVLALVILLSVLPIMFIVAIAIRLDSEGPVLYTQERVGLQGRIFKIVKFRSMRKDAETNGAVWAAETDPRVTSVGKLIRKTRIDELPQLVNILRGEMSLIGPRPERPVFVDELERQIQYYGQRHLIKPGLTGWAQVRYRYGDSVED
ncbi:MAG: TIGR03013 family XrtA/PEP-CTERM system glycosyltransferase, partial [Blastocatellia bacterium]